MFLGLCFTHFARKKKKSVELLDAVHEDEGTQVRRTRRRVISDDDVPVTEVVSAAFHPS